MPRALGYFLSWGTYGTRLQGDQRRTVDRAHNRYGRPVLGHDEQRWEFEQSMMRFGTVVLSREQRLFIEQTVPRICERGLWRYHTCAAAPDHIHVVLGSEHEPKAIRRMLKRWLGESLSDNWKLPEGATWWAECGSIKWLTDQSYFDNAIRYVSRQRTH